MSKASSEAEIQREIYKDRDFSSQPGYAKEKLKFLRRNLPKRLLTGKVLDVGCGDGTFRPLFDRDADYSGLEFSKEQAAKAKKKGLDVKIHDVTTKFPFKKQTFDVVFASEILEHIIDTDGFLQNCNKVLKKGGSLIITTPNIATPISRLRMLFGRRPLNVDHRIAPDLPGHVRA